MSVPGIAQTLLFHRMHDQDDKVKKTGVYTKHASSRTFPSLSRYKNTT